MQHIEAWNPEHPGPCVRSCSVVFSESRFPSCSLHFTSNPWLPVCQEATRSYVEAIAIRLEATTTSNKKLLVAFCQSRNQFIVCSKRRSGRPWQPACLDVNVWLDEDVVWGCEEVSSFLFLVAMPGAPSSVLAVRPGAPRSFLLLVLLSHAQQSETIHPSPTGTCSMERMWPTMSARGAFVALQRLACIRMHLRSHETNRFAWDLWWSM